MHDRIDRVTWREEAPEEANQQPGMGVIAQELEKLFPELVQTTESGLKKVDYGGLIAPVIEAIKELDARVRAVEERLEQRPPPACRSRARRLGRSRL